MTRALKIIGWVFRVLVLLIVAAGGAAYLFPTSDKVRTLAESQDDEAIRRSRT